MRACILGVVMSTCACASNNVNGDIAAFTTKAAWIAAAGDHERLTFQGFPDGTFLVTQYASEGAVFIDGADLIYFNPSFVNDGVGLYGALTHIHVAFLQPTVAVASEFMWGARIRLYSQGQLMYEHLFPSNGPHFGGIVSDVPFDAVVLVSANAGTTAINIDDLYFASSFTGSVPVRPATRIAHVGQTVNYNGNPVTLGTLHAPTTNTLGQVAFNGNTSIPGDSFVWIDDGIAFMNSDVKNATLTGGESCMGISDTGEFVFSPMYNGRDSAFTGQGLLLAVDDPIPPLPGLFSVGSNNWTTMSADGTAYWITRFGPSPGSPYTGRAILRCNDLANPRSITAVMSTNDIIDGFPVLPTSSPIYDISPDGQHIGFHIFVDDPAGGTRFVLDDKVVARQHEPPDGYALWFGFYDMGVNNHADYVFTAATDEFTEHVVYNGDIIASTGDVSDGQGLGLGVRANSINNLGKMATEWTLEPAGAAVFYGHADDMLNAACLLKIGDMIDYTGDGIADAGVTWLNAQTQDGPGITLSDHNFLFIEATLLDVGSNDQYEAILRLDTIPLGNCPVDINDSGAVDSDDLVTVILAWGPCPQPCPPRCSADITGNCAVDADDLVAVILNWGACP